MGSHAITAWRTAVHRSSFPGTLADTEGIRAAIHPRALWQALWQGFRVPPFAAEDIIKQARRYKSRRELTRALRLIARADLALRSNPVSKRLLLEKLVLDLASETQVPTAGWQQEQLPV